MYYSKRVNFYTILIPNVEDHFYCYSRPHYTEESPSCFVWQLIMMRIRPPLMYHGNAGFAPLVYVVKAFLYRTVPVTIDTVRIDDDYSANIPTFSEGPEETR